MSKPNTENQSTELNSLSEKLNSNETKQKTNWAIQLETINQDEAANTKGGFRIAWGGYPNSMFTQLPYCYSEMIILTDTLCSINTNKK